MQGPLRINSRMWEHAYVTDPNPKLSDVLLKGIFDRNRALDGDIVVVEVKPREEWEIMHEKIQARNYTSLQFERTSKNFSYFFRTSLKSRATTAP